MKARVAGRIGLAVLLSAGSVALTVAGGSVLAGWLLVRPGKRRDYDCIPAHRNGRLQSLTLLTSDGLRLHAWLLLAKYASSNNWVLLLHGYRSDRTALQIRARFFSRRGYNVLILHFRGHGGSDPARISYGYYERRDVRAAVEFIYSLRPGRPARIGIDGISMGAAAAAYAAGYGEVRPDWMILESCYDNIRHALANRLALRVGQCLTPWFAWPVELVVEHLVQLRAADLDPAKALESVRCPVLVMAGDSERVLKMVEIEYLYESIGAPKRLVVFPGAGHEDLLAYDTRRYAREVGAFLRDFAALEHSVAPQSEQAVIQDMQASVAKTLESEDQV
jgi:pimeloyl-ACP methyl ester carboxylesterase